MKEIPIRIEVNSADYEIGYITPLPGNPEIFDGWLSETPGGTVDELVVNGAGEWWARYQVLARYMQTLLTEIQDSKGLTEGLPRLMSGGACDRLTGTAEEMYVTLSAHLNQD